MNGVSYMDQMQRTVEIPSTVLRIVSLVPSQTELLVDLGLEARIVGVTKFCIHPAGFKTSVAQVGGTKQVNIAKVRDLKPDLIIGNKEENAQDDIFELEKIAPVWMSDIYTLEDALDMISSLGIITDSVEKAHQISGTIQNGFASLKGKFTHLQASVLYLIWRQPYLAAGKCTFIDWVIDHLGFKNVVEEMRYPEPNFEAIAPDFIWLSSEPYPFKETHIAELKKCFPHAEVILVDGEMFSWYGSRLIQAIEYFNNFLPKALKRGS
jgi:ABC-type Fe3+-hydroxamate transport system substrate-binding protein